MKAERYFLDTSVVLYAVDEAVHKANIADGLIAEGGCLSPQIFNECVEVMRRKWQRSWPEVRTFLEYLETSSRIVPMTFAIHQRAVDVAEATGIRIYDALLVAAAEDGDCSILYTEDLNSGQRIGGVTIHNPFA